MRLKGGDPFVFGLGGEEAQFLLAHHIACHIVPGMTAASACTSYIGIPLTHRNIAQSCIFITGHLQSQKDSSHSTDIPWHILANPKQTVVFYMGVKNLPIIINEIIATGRSAQTPAP